jgi:hypothetical protein
VVGQQQGSLVVGQQQQQQGSLVVGQQQQQQGSLALAAAPSPQQGPRGSRVVAAGTAHRLWQVLLVV